MIPNSLSLSHPLPSCHDPPVFYKFPKQSFWAYCRGDAAIVYHEMFDMGSRLKDLQPLRDGDVVIDGGTNVGLFSLSLLQDESVQVCVGGGWPSLLDCCRSPRSPPSLHPRRSRNAIAWPIP